MKTSRFQEFGRRISSGMLALVTAVAWQAMMFPLQASVDDAHSYAMEAAVPFVEQGFIVREDYWNGEVKSGQKLMVKHQLFKGNEYAFWLATGMEVKTIDLKVYDDKGKAIELDTKKEEMWVTVRVNPPRTGTYTVVFYFETDSKTEPGVTWALAYGYR